MTERQFPCPFSDGITPVPTPPSLRSLPQSKKARPELIAQAALAFPSIYQRKPAKTGYIDIVWNLPSITALP